SAEQVGAEDGSNEEGENQRPEQGEGDGPSHGAKQAAFDPLQRENRKIGNDDDDAGEEHWFLYFVSGSRDDFTERSLVISEGSMAQDVLDHDHGAIDDHAEIESSQREEIRGDVPEIKKNRGEEQRKGDGDGDDEGAADVAEKQKQDEGDKQNS